MLERLFGKETAEALRSPFVLGDTQALLHLFRDAGVPDAHIATHEGSAHFPSIESWVFTDVKGWTAADLIDEAGYARLLAEAERELRPFVTADGTVAFACPPTSSPPPSQPAVRREWNPAHASAQPTR